MIPRSFAPRLIASLCIVGALMLWQGEALMQHLLRPIALTIDALDRQHQVIALDIARVEADTVIRMEAGIRALILTGTHVTFADPRARAVITTPLAAFWLAPSVLLALLMAWPASSIAASLWRLPLAVPALACVLLLDAPFVLDALLWGLHRDAHDPHGTSAILVWSTFLKAGGRFLLGAAAAAAVITLSHAIAARLRPATSR